MKVDFLIYFVPLIPILLRSVFVLQLRKKLCDQLSEEELDRDNIRNTTLALEGFSFAGLLALVLIEPNIKQNLTYPIYFVIISFISYMIQINLQGYKSRRWQEILSDTLFELGSLGLIMTVVCLLFMSGLNNLFIYIMTLISILGWLIDFLIRLKIQFEYINKEDNNE